MKYTKEPTVCAPYNFVGVSERVYRREKTVAHNAVGTGLLSGKLEYEIEALTPICVEDGKGNFYKDCYGRTAIPGSTIRGLVRSNVQILSCSSIRDDIQNNHLMYRDIASKKTPYSTNKDIYAEVLGCDTDTVRTAGGHSAKISVLRNVKAGYLCNVGGRFEIIHTEADLAGNFPEGMNYYVLSERLIMNNNFAGFEYLRNLMYNGHFALQNLPDRRDVKKSFEKQVRGKRVSYQGNENRSYEPYYLPISYRTKKGGRRIVSVDAPEKLEHQGTLVSTGYMRQKKSIYVIPAMKAEAGVIAIPQESVDSFRHDYAAKKKQVESMHKTFFALPAEGEKPKPVFYIEYGGKLYFGFTPHLRLFYDQDILAGLPEEQKRAELDYSKALFGYASGKDCYKGRLSFMDALLTKEEEATESCKMVLGEPKPSSYVNYLRPVKGPGVVSYNDAGAFVLRGVKQYWLKQEPDSWNPESKTRVNENVLVTLKLLKKGVRFEGAVRFANVSREELGMLLWGLFLEKESNQNVGRGKPFGYGRIAVRLRGLYLEDQERLYRGELLCLEPYREATGEAESFVQAAKEDMTRFLGSDVMKMPSVRDFLLMKDSSKIPPSGMTQYMTLDEYSMQKQNAVRLSEVEDVIEGKTVKVPVYERNSVCGQGKSGKSNGCKDQSGSYGENRYGGQKGGGSRGSFGRGGKKNRNV